MLLLLLLLLLENVLANKYIYFMKFYVPLPREKLA